MTKKRILIFSLVYYPRFIGGAEIAIKEITDRLPKDGYEFDMVTLRLDKALPKDEQIGNVHVYRVGFTSFAKDSPDSLKGFLHYNKYLLALTGYRQAVKLHRKNNYDAIWSMMATYNSFAALLLKLRFKKVPFILTLQEGDPIEYIKGRVGIFMPLFRKIFLKADLIQTISNYLSDFAREMGYRGRVEMIPNGVDGKCFDISISEVERQKIREHLGFSKSDTILITTSRLVVKNAVDDVIKSLSHLDTSVKFLILGQGYEEERLRKLAKNLGVVDRVVFKGYVPHVEMPNFLKASDIFIRPSLSEGFGNSFIEAMASGLPVIGTLEGGIKDFLVDSKTGLSVRVKDPEGIAKAVERLKDNRILREEIVKTAHKMALEKYDWDLIAKSMDSRVFGTT